MLLGAAFTAGAFPLLVDETYAVGDADNDGKSNALDLIEIKKGLVYATEINEQGSDINCDGSVNAKDLLVLGFIRNKLRINGYNIIACQDGGYFNRNRGTLITCNGCIFTVVSNGIGVVPLGRCEGKAQLAGGQHADHQQRAKDYG